MPETLNPVPLVPSDRFVGRKKELKFILDKLDQNNSVSASLILVEGQAGMGKTSLVNTALELHKRKKYFKLYGKFENQKENTPFLALKQAFAQWGNQILLLSDEEFDELKETATTSLQTNITAITGMFSELEVFFSRKKLLANKQYKGDASQIKSRFYYFFKKFLASVASLDYRLIIFLDDLQWADRASMLLMEELLLRAEIPELIFIGTYRPHHEQGSAFFEKVDLFKNHSTTSYLELTPLRRQTVNTLLPEWWGFSGQDSEAFKKFLWIESQGNPFKITEILKSVHRKKIRNFKAEKESLFWEKLPKFHNKGEASEFVKIQLGNLPLKHQKIISMASCLGYHFDPQLLLSISSYPSVEVEKALAALCRQDFLVKKRSLYGFTHDNIFAAANSLLLDTEKSSIHKSVGFRLLNTLGNYVEPLFFQAVNHLNRAGNDWGAQSAACATGVLLNIQAGKLAIKKSAFEEAERYFAQVEHLCENLMSPIRIEDPKMADVFETNEITPEALQFQILFGLAESCFLLQKLEPALNYANRVLTLNSNRHQKVLATLIKIRICSAIIYQRNVRPILLDGLGSLEQVLFEFGIDLSTAPETMQHELVADCKLLYEKASGNHENKDYIALLNPDREYQDLLRLITTSMTFLYYMDVRKNTYMAVKTLLMCMEKGYAPVTPILFTASFLTAHFSEENRTLAHILGKRSLEMIKVEPYKRCTHVIFYVATLNYFAWEHHYRDCIVKLKENIQFSLEAGDPHYASFCSTNIRILNSYRGKNLEKHLQYCKKLEKNHHIFFISSSDNDLTRHLTGEKPGFDTHDFKFSEDLIREAEHNMSSRYHLQIALQKLYYLSGHTEKALEAGNIIEQLENVYSGFQIELEHYFFYSLGLLKAAFEKGELPQDHLDVIHQKLIELRRLAAFKSGNYLHKELLIEAELAKCRGEFENATDLYDRAIHEARKQGFIHHVAIASERASEYYLSKGKKEIARLYLKKAIKFYTRWGAHAKVAQLEKKYPALKINDRTQTPGFLPATQYSVIKEILSKTVPGNKIELAQLGQYLISTLVSESKAEKGVLLFLANTGWIVLAADKIVPEITNSSLNRLRYKLPIKILNYSIKKGENLLFEDVSKNLLFQEEPYLLKEKPANLSVFPVKQGAETIGLIYLENTGVRSDAEKDLFLVLLELVSTTFANAVYYAKHEQLNEELKLQEHKRIEAVIESEEKERERIARELHDSVGQMLALIRLKASSLELVSQTLAGNELLTLIDESCDEVRSISHNIMPPDLGSKSIEEILTNLIKKNRELNGLTYYFMADGISDDLSVAVKFTLYRVLQEIIQNIIKHAFASKVTVSLTQTEDLVNLVVEDNGKGFDKNFIKLGLGLKNIHSRVKLLNGYLDIDSSIDNGTVFNISIPLKL